MSNKAILATMVAVVLGLAAWGTAEAGSTMFKGKNIVKVHSCTQVGEDIVIKYKKNGPEAKLTSGCRNAGHGFKDYTMTCISPKKYKVSWEACAPVAPASSISQLSVAAAGSQVNLGSANSSYQTLGFYAAKQLVTVDNTIDAIKFAVDVQNAAPDANHSYAFVWVDSTTGPVNFSQKLASSLVTSAHFGSKDAAALTIGDYYRGRHITLLAFMRDNDGISRVPNMPVEVDDVIAIHIKFIPKPVAPSPAPAPAVSQPITFAALMGMNPATINFEDSTLDLETAFSTFYGITFTSKNGKIIFIGPAHCGNAATASGKFSVMNDAAFPKTSANDPLIVSLEQGAKAIGFYLGNGHKYGTQVTATIKLYGADDKLLGIFTRKPGNPVTTFFAAKANETIYKVSVDYGDTTLSEVMDDFMYVPAGNVVIN